MSEEFPGQTQASPAEQAQQSRLAAVAQRTKQVFEWATPAVGDALKKEADIDVYDFVGAEQPELTVSQQFGSGVAQFAMREARKRIAERAAA